VPLPYNYTPSLKEGGEVVGVVVNLGLGLPPCLKPSNAPIGRSDCCHMPLSLSIFVDSKSEHPTTTLGGGFLKLGDDGPLLPNFGESIIPKVRHVFCNLQMLVHHSKML